MAKTKENKCMIRMNTIHKCHIIASLLEWMNHRLSMTNNLEETLFSLNHSFFKSVALQIECTHFDFAFIKRDLKKWIFYL